MTLEQFIQELQKLVRDNPFDKVQTATVKMMVAGVRHYCNISGIYYDDEVNQIVLVE